MAVDERESTGFFLREPQKLDNPFPDFAYFRQNRPIFYYPALDGWFIFSFDSVSILFTDDRLGNGLGALLDSAPPSMHDELQKVAVYLNMFIVIKEGEEHARMRTSLNQAFAADHIAGIGVQTQKIADELLDRIQTRHTADVCSDYAILLPVYVLCDFIGVPEQDRDRMMQWSTDFVDFFNIAPATIETSQRLVRSGLELADYTRRMLAARRANPQHDLLGILASGQTEAGGLTDDEIVGNIMMLLVAGHISVRNLIGNAIYLLLSHPDQRARLQAEPALLRNAIEETLRYEPPVSMIARTANQQFDFQGNTIRKGQLLQLSIASANRDEAHFPDADRFDITRQPSRLLSFGAGAHACIGAYLAREEAHIALGTLFRRVPNLRLDDTRAIQWHRDAGNRGPIALPVVF